MSIDPLTEPTFSLSRAARRLPHLRNDRPVSPSTLWRWANKGVGGVRLETVRCGGVTVTSEDALRRFFAALSGQVAPPQRQEPASPDDTDTKLRKRGYR